MKANSDKYHLLVTRGTGVTTKIEQFDIKKSREEKLLAVKISKKVSQIFYTLERVVNFKSLIIVS